MRTRAFRRHQAYRHMWRRLKEDRNQHYNDLTCPCWHQPKVRASRSSRSGARVGDAPIAGNTRATAFRSAGRHCLTICSLGTSWSLGLSHGRCDNRLGRILPRPPAHSAGVSRTAPLRSLMPGGTVLVDANEDCWNRQATIWSRRRLGTGAPDLVDCLAALERFPDAFHDADDLLLTRAGIDAAGLHRDRVAVSDT